MEPHRVIWLQPWCQACARTEDRMWCHDNVWSEGCEECGAMPVKYALVPGQPLPCETCGGTGEIDQRLGGAATSGVVPCPDCR